MFIIIMPGRRAGPIEILTGSIGKNRIFWETPILGILHYIALGPHMGFPGVIM